MLINGQERRNIMGTEAHSFKLLIQILGHRVRIFLITSFDSKICVTIYDTGCLLLDLFLLWGILVCSINLLNSLGFVKSNYLFSFFQF